MNRRQVISDQSDFYYQRCVSVSARTELIQRGWDYKLYSCWSGRWRVKASYKRSVWKCDTACRECESTQRGGTRTSVEILHFLVFLGHKRVSFRGNGDLRHKNPPGAPGHDVGSIDWLTREKKARLSKHSQQWKDTKTCGVCGQKYVDAMLAKWPNTLPPQL